MPATKRKSPAKSPRSKKLKESADENGDPALTVSEISSMSEEKDSDMPADIEQSTYSSDFEARLPLLFCNESLMIRLYFCCC